VFVGTSLIDMYGKCGDLSSDKGVFDSICYWVGEERMDGMGTEIGIKGNYGTKRELK
jgi:hypothetical protein